MARLLPGFIVLRFRRRREVPAVTTQRWEPDSPRDSELAMTSIRLIPTCTQHLPASSSGRWGTRESRRLDQAPGSHPGQLCDGSDDAEMGHGAEEAPAQGCRSRGRIEGCDDVADLLSARRRGHDVEGDGVAGPAGEPSRGWRTVETVAETSSGRKQKKAHTTKVMQSLRVAPPRLEPTGRAPKKTAGAFAPAIAPPGLEPGLS
jgi:hypothetical protein